MTNQNPRIIVLRSFEGPRRKHYVAGDIARIPRRFASDAVKRKDAVFIGEPRTLNGDSVVITVKALRTFQYGSRKVNPGATCEVEERHATALIKARMAVPSEPLAPKAKLTPPIPASDPPPIPDSDPPPIPDSDPPPGPVGPDPELPGPISLDDTELLKSGKKAELWKRLKELDETPDVSWTGSETEEIRSALAAKLGVS